MKNHIIYFSLMSFVNFFEVQLGVYGECYFSIYLESYYEKKNLNTNEIKFPIRKVYTFYPWEEMAKGYCAASNIVFN
jgi:hypothetical protein